MSGWTPQLALTLCMKASPDHLSTAEAAGLLGWTSAKVREAVRQDRLPAVVVGGNIRIARTAVEQIVGAEDRPNRPTATGATEVELVERVLGLPISELPLLLEPEWLAPRLGMSAAAVRRSMRAGEIPAVIVGKRHRCPTIALVRWLAAAGSAA